MASSEDNIKVPLPSGETIEIAIPKRKASWLEQIPLWGVFGAIAAGVWIAAGIAQDAKATRVELQVYMEATNNQLRQHSAEIQADHDWRIAHDAKAETYFNAVRKGPRQ